MVSKVFWAAYPLLVTFVVVVTGNHFWLDAAAGALVAGVSALVAAARARARLAGSLVVAQPRRAPQRDLRAAAAG